MSVYDRQIFQNFSGISSDGKVIVTIWKLENAVTIIGSVGDDPFVAVRATWIEAVQAGLRRTIGDHPAQFTPINEAFADAIAKFKMDYTELTHEQRQELRFIGSFNGGQEVQS